MFTATLYASDEEKIMRYTDEVSPPHLFFLFRFLLRFYCMFGFLLVVRLTVLGLVEHLLLRGGTATSED